MPGARMGFEIGLHLSFFLFRQMTSPVRLVYLSPPSLPLPSPRVSSPGPARGVPFPVDLKFEKTNKWGSGLLMVLGVPAPEGGRKLHMSVTILASHRLPSNRPFSLHLGLKNSKITRLSFVNVILLPKR